MCIIKGVREDFKQGSQRSKNLKARIPRAVSAHYDRKTGRIVIHLSSKLIVSFSPADAEGPEGAQPSQLKEIEISPSGFGIHFPALSKWKTWGQTKEDCRTVAPVCPCAGR